MTHKMTDVANNVVLIILSRLAMFIALPALAFFVHQSMSDIRETRDWSLKITGELRALSEATRTGIKNNADLGQAQFSTLEKRIDRIEFLLDTRK